MTSSSIKLDFPIDSDGVKTDKLTMRRPKVGDMLASDKSETSEAAKEIALFCNLCEVSPSVIHDMDLKDYQKMQGVYAGFLS